MLKNLIILPVFCALLAACGSETSSPPSPPNDQKPTGEIQGALSEIIVVDIDGSPIANASVMIGSAPNQPFSNNIV